METLGYRVAITRNYGSVSVTLELSSLTGGDTPSERDIEFDRLTKELERQHARISDSTAIQHASAGQSQQGQATGASVATESFVVTGVERVYWQNKPCVKIRGGKYQKHGVICYPEVWEALDFKAWFDKNPDDDLTVWTATLQLSLAGNPQRVMSVVRNG